MRICLWLDSTPKRSGKNSSSAILGPPEEFEQQSERGHSTGSLGATLQFIVNDGNNENEEGASKGLSGEGDSNAVPFPRPQPLLGDAKTLK